MRFPQYCYWCDRPMCGGHKLNPCGQCKQEDFLDLDEIWSWNKEHTGFIHNYAEYERSVIFPEIYQQGDEVEPVELADRIGG